MDPISLMRLFLWDYNEVVIYNCEGKTKILKSSSHIHVPLRLNYNQFGGFLGFALVLPLGQKHAKHEKTRACCSCHFEHVSILVLAFSSETVQSHNKPCLHKISLRFHTNSDCENDYYVETQGCFFFDEWLDAFIKREWAAGRCLVVCNKL